MGAGMVSLLGGKLRAGIDTILDTVGFDQVISDADFVITGEGSLDYQSLRGQVVVGVAGRAKLLGKPVIAVVGDIADGLDSLYDDGLTAVFSTNRLAIPFSLAKPRSRHDYEETVSNIARLIKAVDVASFSHTSN